ncbi:MAG: efflux RND transporter permease subunit [Bacteroidetes bacterium]|nr:efflux RND transporter permease subunit [Bacteroidota bacterium]
MEKLISYFIKYPVAVNVFILFFLIFGTLGFMSMRSSFFPLIDSRIITINVAFPGASPQEVEEGVILKIEDNLKGLVGLERVTSVSRENSGTITIEIFKGENVDVILQEVKNAVDRVPSYPVGMEPLVVAKQETVRQTISFAVSGEGVDLAVLKQITRQIENDMRAMEGISQVEITGYPDEEIEVAVRESDLLAYNLTFQEVAQAVSQNNILITGGNIKTSAEEYLIRANNRAYYADEILNTVVRADASGRTVTLEDVAVVRNRFAETPNASYFNGNISVNVSISNTNEEDLISTAEIVRNYVSEFNQKYNNVRVDIVNDSSITLNQRTQLLLENAAMGIALVLLFLAVFLNIRLAFWVAVGIPLSFFGMFIFANQLDITINLLSLFGMIVVIGILVDDGIVVAENIYQHYERGKSRVRAAIDGTLEVIPPIVSAILTTVLAFSIFIFIDGRIGDFFGEVSKVVIITLLISLIEALLILPAHMAHSKAMLKDDGKPKKGMALFFEKIKFINKGGDWLMNKMRDKFYTPSITWVMNHKFIFFASFAAMLILTIASMQGGIIGQSLFPRIASDRISVTLAMPEGTSARTTDSIISMIEEKAWSVNQGLTEKQTGNKPVIENIIKRVGPGSANASLTINLLPGEERDLESFVITNAVRDAVGPVYGVENLTFGFGGNFGGSPISISLLGSDIEQLKAAKVELKAAMKENPKLKDVVDNDPSGIKEIRIKLNESAYLLGLNYQSVMAQVRNGFFGFQAQRLQRGQDEIRVWVRYDRENRSTINDLDEMRIVTPTGDRVPFKEIGEYEIVRGEVAINHLDNRREIQLNADLENPNSSSSDIMNDIRDNIVPAILQRHPSVTASFEGQNREANKIQNSAKQIAPIVFFLIFVVIAFTFRSLSQPIILFMLVPFSVIAVAWGHYFSGFPVNMISWLGIIALVGIMVNDGLVLIDKFNSMLRDGMPFEQAVIEAGKSRFRAIFLTSVTTIAGMAPLLLEESRQAQFLKPMAISISYGIGLATFLTLFLLPVFLAANNNLKRFIHWLVTGEKIAPEALENAIIELKAEQEADEIH